MFIYERLQKLSSLQTSQKGGNINKDQNNRINEKKQANSKTIKKRIGIQMEMK
jgi:hypothetical protein